jgi:hypothetical protein
MPYIGNPIYQSAFVTDQFSGTGSATAFTMSVAPAGVSNVLVAVSGVLQDPSTYGVAGTTITFSTAPPSGTGNISCRYLGVPVTGITTTAYRTVTEFTATAGQTTFTPPSYTPSFINVYLNGVLLGSADYTATNGTTVVLATGAAAGNLVTVESFQISSVANAIQNTAGAVSSSNIQTGVALTNPTVTGTLGVSGTLTSGSGSANYLTINGNTAGQPAYINLAGSDTNVGLDFNTKGTGAFRVNVNSTTITNTNSYGIGLGGATPSSGIGITFPAAQSASTDPNTLDDYEEGTWTPTLNANLTPNSGYTAGQYIKIGRLCYINYALSVGTVSGSNAISISVPFAGSANPTNGRADQGFPIYTAGVDTGPAGTYAYLGTNFTSLEFYGIYDNASGVQLTNANLATNDFVFVNICYITAS